MCSAADFQPWLPLDAIIANDGRIRRFPRGDMIIRKDEYGSSLFVILEGWSSGWPRPPPRAAGGVLRPGAGRHGFARSVGSWPDAGRRNTGRGGGRARRSGCASAPQAPCARTSTHSPRIIRPSPCVRRKCLASSRRLHAARAAPASMRAKTTRWSSSFAGRGCARSATGRSVPASASTSSIASAVCCAAAGMPDLRSRGRRGARRDRGGSLVRDLRQFRLDASLQERDRPACEHQSHHRAGAADLRGRQSSRRPAPDQQRLCARDEARRQRRAHGQPYLRQRHVRPRRNRGGFRDDASRQPARHRLCRCDPHPDASGAEIRAAGPAAGTRAQLQRNRRDHRRSRDHASGHDGLLRRSPIHQRPGRHGDQSRSLRRMRRLRAGLRERSQ